MRRAVTRAPPCGVAGHRSNAGTTWLVDQLSREKQVMTARSTPDHSPWNSAPLSDLIRFIVARYHDTLRAELPELSAMAQLVEARHRAQPTCPRGLAVHLDMVRSAVIEHLEKEEKVLFPMILEGYGARTAGPVRVMTIEHEEHVKSLARTRTLTRNLTPPDDACPTWRDLYVRLDKLESDLLEHMRLENEVLFPRVLNDSQGSRFRVHRFSSHR
jgi:regulator of cell morphogenesis and NO signaling